MVRKRHVSMIGKCRDHTLYTNTVYREEEPQNINSRNTPGRQTKQSNQLSLPLQDDCKKN